MKAYVLMSGEVALKVFLDEKEARNELRDQSFRLKQARKFLFTNDDVLSQIQIHHYIVVNYPELLYVFHKVGLNHELTLVEKELV